jgi:hypothetical protein
MTTTARDALFAFFFCLGRLFRKIVRGQNLRRRRQLRARARETTSE